MAERGGINAPGCTPVACMGNGGLPPVVDHGAGVTPGPMVSTGHRAEHGLTRTRLVSFFLIHRPGAAHRPVRHIYVTTADQKGAGNMYRYPGQGSAITNIRTKQWKSIAFTSWREVSGASCAQWVLRSAADRNAARNYGQG